MKKILLLAALAAAGWVYFHEPPAGWKGIPAARDPAQTADQLPPAWAHGEYTLTPLARYAVTAVVLSRDRYRLDRGAELSPVDLALGWGPMSVAAVVNDLKFSQSGRWYEYTYRGEPPLEPGLIASHSANTHCLPADDTVRAQLLAVRRHDLVTAEGYLVQVTAPDGYRWRSSLRRDDTGGGACEVFWITGLTRRAL